MTAIKRNKASLFVGAGAAALALGLTLAPSTVAAQAFNASPTVVNGSANQIVTGTGTETIEVSTPTAVIDWVPFEDVNGDALTFLPLGHTATFQDDIGQGGFAVLNRILPSTNNNVVEMNGAVISQLQVGSGQFESGGDLAFYSPTGLLIGSSATFDVGSLMLTALEPDIAQYPGFIAGTQGLNFSDSTIGLARVEIAPGSLITASPEGSYLTVVAPEILMDGTANINGSSAFIGARQVTVGHSNGLFDISIAIGADGPVGIDHTGTTGGPSSTGIGDNHIIYFAVNPSMDPVDILLSGSLGYDAPLSAGIDNGDIIITAGGGTIGRTIVASAPGAADSSAALFDATVTSSIDAFATTSFFAEAANGDLIIQDSVDVLAYQSILFESLGTNTLTVDGLLSLNSRGAELPGGDVVGGIIDIISNTGSTMNLNSGISAFAVPEQFNGAAVGGTISLLASGQTNITGPVVLSSSISTSTVGGSGGMTTGGSTRIIADGGNLTINGDVSGFASSTDLLNSGAASTGGTAEIAAENSGVIDITGNVILAADASGNAVAVSGTGAAAQGGFAGVNAFGGTVTIDGDVTLRANGNAGEGTDGGNAFGGAAGVFVATGSVSIMGNVTADTQALAGNAANGLGGNGGNAISGTAYVQADGSSTETATALITGNAVLFNDGIGGNGGDGNVNSAIEAGDGGNGVSSTTTGARLTGGTFVFAGNDNGSVTIGGNTFTNANGIGGVGGSNGSGTAGGDGGDGIGGGIVIATFTVGGTTGAIGNGQMDLGGIFASTEGTGGNGGSIGGGPALTGVGGDGLGGTAQIGSIGAPVNFGTLQLDARGEGGDGSLNTAGRAGNRRLRPGVHFWG